VLTLKSQQSISRAVSTLLPFHCLRGIHVLIVVNGRGRIILVQIRAIEHDSTGESTRILINPLRHSFVSEAVDVQTSWYYPYAEAMEDTSAKSYGAYSESGGKETRYFAREHQHHRTPCPRECKGRKGNSGSDGTTLRVQRAHRPQWNQHLRSRVHDSP
jgi:hypothetical protein